MARCLLIDEDSKESRSLQHLLDLLGLDTAQAAKPDEALQYCNDNSPDVVLLAANGSSGRPRDFVRRLRRNVNGKRPVVFLYAETPDTEIIGQSILQGAADVLMKPFDRDILHFKLKLAGVIA
ncbi:MAG: response regulator [Rhizobiales bacterium]|nr:response regulator [Hyphomicrobiales bacterium]MBI3673188.1 response regulator [Hyphomicrobiales bacterium]